MRKRAVDLSMEELAALGKDAALRAAKKAQDAGLVVTGTVDFLENGQAVSKLAQRLPSGAVVLLDPSADPSRSPNSADPAKLVLRGRD